MKNAIEWVLIVALLATVGAMGLDASGIINL